MFSRPLQLSLAFLVLFLSACGGGGGSSSGSGDGLSHEMRNACDGLYWETAATPLDNVLIRDLSGPILELAETEPAAVYGELLADDGSVLVALPVAAARDEYDELVLKLVAPAHPETPFTGGVAQVRLVVNGDRCPTRTLDVAGLPEPTDPTASIAAVIQQIERMLSRQASAFGLSLADIEAEAARVAASDATTLSELGIDAGLIPLLLAYDGLETLRALNDTEGLGSEDRRILAAMLESVGPNGYAGGLSDMLDGMPPPAPTSPTITTLSTSTLGSPGTTTTISAMSSGQCASFIAGQGITIDDAWSLDHYMTEQRDAEVAMDPTASVQGAVVGGVEAVLPIASILSGGVATAAGAMIYVHKLVQLFTINTLPAEFVELQPAVLQPGTEINEDYQGSPKWDQFMATATSRGMDLAGPTLEGVQMLLGTAGWANSANDVGGDIRDDIVEFGADQLEGAAKSAAWDVWGTLETVLTASGCFHLAPRVYGPIDITHRDYTRASTDGTALTLSEGTRNKTNINLVHTGEANVLLQTVEDKFGGRSGSWAERFSVREITLEPDPYFIQADSLGAEEHVSVYPRWADHPENLSVTVTPQPAVGSVTYGPDLVGQHFLFGYQTPSDESKYPVFLDIKTTGTLPSGSPSGTLERRTEVEISNRARVVVSPESACVEPGESRTLTAQIMGRSSPDFDWELAGSGSLSGATQGNDVTVENNEFIAPGGPAEATVTVTHTDPDGETASANIDLVVGDCDAQVFVDGVLSTSASSGGDSESWEQELPGSMTSPPEKSSPLWLGVTETFQSPQQSAIATHYFYDDGSSCDTANGRSCNTADAAYSAQLDADSVANTVFAVDAGGAATFDFTWQGGNQCIDDTNGDSVCSSSAASAFWSPVFYVDLAQAGDYEFDIDLTCTEGNGAVGSFGYRVTLYRFPDGSVDEGDAMPLNGFPHDPLHGSEYIVDMFLTSDNACTDGSVSYNRVYSLAAPVQPGTEDLIVVMVTVEGHAAPLVNNYPDEWRLLVWPFRSTGQVSTEEIQAAAATQEDSITGPHEGNVTLWGSAYFRRTR